MTVATKIMMGSGAVAEAYEIEQSIIYNSASNSQMYFDPSSNFTSETVFTFSTWVKRASTGASQRLLTAGYYTDGNNQSGMSIQFHSSDVLRVNLKRVGGVTYNNQNIDSAAVFRDPAAWYHILVTRNGTAIKGYVNGVEVLSGTMTANSVVGIQNTYPVMVGVSSKPTSSAIGAYQSFNGNLAETHFIDGTAKATSDFGETNSDTGQWIPKEYSGSYGTNGCYMKFASGAIGTDSSGEGNNYTVSNLANSDVVIDTPTNNFATYDPNVPTSYYVFSEGNLKVTVPNQWRITIASMGVSTGKWYWEQLVSSGTQNTHFGFCDDSAFFLDAGNYVGYKPGSWSYAGSNGKLYNNGGIIGSTLTVTSTDGGKIGIAMDLDNQKVWFSLNGTWMGTNANPSTGAGAAITNIVAGDTYYPATTVYGLSSTANFGQNGTFSGVATAGGNADTNGIGDFFYAVPTGFKALCTANLPDPAIPLPSAHFNTVLYTGNGGTNAITGVGFQPDWVWAKVRDEAYSHGLFDAVRGVTKKLSSNLTNAEVTDSGLTAFGSDGFTMGSDAGMNGSSKTYVAWNWKANGAGSTNNDGNQASVVSANQAAGFSIATYTGTGSYATYGHGLGVIPEVTLTKSRSAAGDGYFVTTAIDGSVDYLVLNTTAAKGNGSATASTTSVFYSNYPNNQTVVAYNFASKPGFSKIGSYTGNGNDPDGPFVNLGFKPAWVLIKDTTGSSNGWILFDSARSPFNEVGLYLLPNSSAAEADYDRIDLLSNGFKLRHNYGGDNANNSVYLYMAFAESPFKTANAR